MRFDQCAAHCIVSNFRLHQLHRDSESFANSDSRGKPHPCGSWSFPAYRGSALVKSIQSSHLPLVCNEVFFSHPSHLLLLILGFCTKPQRQCLQFTRVCGLCYHPSLSNFMATCQAEITRLVAGHPSSGLLQAFHQSNFMCVLSERQVASVWVTLDGLC